jgi:hypothetical protein
MWDWDDTRDGTQVVDNFKEILLDEKINEPDAGPVAPHGRRHVCFRARREEGRKEEKEEEEGRRRRQEVTRRNLNSEFLPRLDRSAGMRSGAVTILGLSSIENFPRGRDYHISRLCAIP